MARYFSFMFISAVVRSSCMQLSANIRSTPMNDLWRDGPYVGSSGKLHCFGPGASRAGRSFQSLEKAQEQCSNDSSCNFIWSRQCDGVWTTCEISVPVESVGDESSCTMLKPANQLPLGQRRIAEVHSNTNFILRSKQEPGADMVDWKLCNATVHSNLGNMGPDSGDSEIRYRNVATVSGQGDIDFVITNTTEYSASSVDNNGLKDCFGLINILSPSTVTLSFRFVLSGTNDLVELSQSFFTVYDLDESKKGMQEQISFNTSVSSYYLMPDSELVTSTDGALTFTSSEVGTGGDNPSDPETLTSDQEARAVTVEYTSVSEYTITFSAIGEPTNKVNGRNFLFAGKSDLTEDAPETDCASSSCEVWADPHVSGFDNAAKGPVSFIGGYMSTFDRQPVDVNAYETGDFWLVKSADVQIQGRYRLSKEFGGGRAAVGALAVGGSFIGDFRLTVEPKSGTIEWNGKQLAESSKFELGNASIPVVVETYYNASHDRGTAPSGVDVSLPRGVFLRVRRYNTHLDLKITATKRLGATDGQCGNFNGDARDDSLEHIKGRMHVLTVAPQDSLFSS